MVVFSTTPALASSPKENFAAFAEWVLVGNGSSFTISPVDITSHALHPEPSQPTLMNSYEMMLEPTVNSETKPATMYKPEPERRTDPTIAPEPEPRQTSDQVREPATLSVPVGLLLEFKGMEPSSSASSSKLRQSDSPASTDSLQPLGTSSDTTPLCGCALCLLFSIIAQASGSPGSISVNLSALSWLLPPSAPPDTIVLTAPPGSLVPPAQPWSDFTLPTPRTYKPSAVLHLSTPSTPSGSTFPPASPQSSGTLAPP
ncbi:hypothetical protein DPX16_19389 [Anabarilius grahami]|uniref:Uncharacterized protein n=1 Tax=Anabarilius grahami TaxID=495550 RepID=A0A3N0Z098_ANAGA|nr:hypothetical protein DPX16_19389 [Anabarilius grahami]